MRHARLLFCLLLSQFTFGAFGSADAADRKELKAGAARVVINPDMGELIVGNFGMPPATQIHDDITARCLLLDNGEARIAFVIVDSVHVPRGIFDAARALITSDSEIAPVGLVMSSTHTHSATSSGDWMLKSDALFNVYQQRAINGIYEAVKQASSHVQPVRVAWGSFDESSHLNNRRWYVSDPALLVNPIGGTDQVRMNPAAGSAALVRPAGPVDPQFSFISVRTLDGTPLSLLANYSLHYVGGVPSGVISADYFGVFNDQIGTLLNGGNPVPGFVGLYSNGTSGDVNNVDFSGKNKKAYQPFEKMTEVATQLAERTAVEEKKLQWHDWVPLKLAETELVLQVRQPDEALARHVAAVLTRPEGEAGRHGLESVYARRIKGLMDGPKEISAKLQAARIGEQVITSIPFEVFAEIGLEIKEKSPFAATFTISLANGGYGYLPTPAQHAVGGYETWLGTNNVQLDSSEKIVEQLLKLIDTLQ
ncbi:hypothetical protein [Schlesneria sp. DSM 10557]|uniref:hypothetical protein n=1 Tax=Schlesneria sp. DSM 10557 TaxID=3044399 RepID=UPI0035A1692D